jgi:hypothetical protein
MKICVTTNRAPKGEETPWVFYVGCRRLHVTQVLDRWTDSVHRYFEVCVDDGRRFVLRLDPPARVWELVAVFAASAKRPAPKTVNPAEPRKFFSVFTARGPAKTPSQGSA